SDDKSGRNVPTGDGWRHPRHQAPSSDRHAEQSVSRAV
ncbi:hypothetical protein A2U01_0091011, partial [Trifolium medium]|nr:hypothetical protein [Trifolium medium]